MREIVTNQLTCNKSPGKTVGGGRVSQELPKESLESCDLQNHAGGSLPPNQQKRDNLPPVPGIMMTFLGFGACGDEVRSSGQHGRSPASPGAATGITHRPATIYATRNTHQRLSALSVVPTGSYLSYQCSLRPVPVVAVLTFRGTYFTFSIFTNPDSEDALCEVLQIDEIPALRTTDPRLHQPKRHDSGQHRPAS